MQFHDAINLYQKDKSTWKESAKKLTEQMTLSEKIHMLSGHPIFQEGIDFLKTGRIYNVRPYPAGGCKRLGIPKVLFTDGPRGVVMHNSTCFPVSMLRASAFDTDLEYRVGKAIAAESIAQGANYFAGVCINLVRNPAWGRSQESYGEDPCILGAYGAALTKSVQEEGMIACPKHFALNSIEDLRFFIDVRCDDRTLYEVYLPHFKKCVDAGAYSIMGAYNRFDEEYCCENKRLLTDILRKEWGFDGFTLSDFVWGTHETAGGLRAGMDVEMVLTHYYSPARIRHALKSGKINEEHVNRAVQNIVGVLIRQIPNLKEYKKDVVGCKAHRALAKEAALKGMVLLKNNGILPLSKDAKIMVAGPYAKEANIGDKGSSRVFDTEVVTPFDGMKTVFKNVSLTDGDIAVLHVGSNRNIEGEYFAKTNYAMKKKAKNSGGDRASLRLSQEDVALIQNLKQQGKKIIVVLYSGCAIITEEWKDLADAIVMNYYSGCQGAVALAELLSGQENFSGKLPFVVAKNEKDYPPILRIGEKPYVITYDYYHGYTKFDKEGIVPAYPFGFGLSYTTFAVSNVSAKVNGDTVEVTATMQNTGTKDGADVLQVYFGSNGAKNGEHRPVKVLKGFQRVELSAGESKEVTVSVSVDDLKFYDRGRWELDEAYTVYVGDDSMNAMQNKAIVTF